MAMTWQDYLKAVRVVRSCKTLAQLAGARRYLTLLHVKTGDHKNLSVLASLWRACRARVLHKQARKV